MMRRLQRLLFYVALACIVVVFVEQVRKAGEYEWTVSAPKLLLSVLGLFVSFYTGPWCFNRILTRLGYHIAYRKAFSIWCISSVARYVPGGIWAYVSRAAMLRRENVKMGAVTLSLFLEQALLMLSAVALSFPYILSFYGLDFSPALMVAIVIALSFSIHPRVLGLLAKGYAVLSKSAEVIRIPGIWILIEIYVCYLVHWIIFSFAFLMFFESLYPLQGDQYLPVMFSNLTAFAIGLVLLIFPGGIGVRESVLYVLLAPSFPSSVCIIVAVGSRLWMTAVELLAVVVALLLQRGEVRRGAGHG